MGEQPIFTTKAHVFHIDPTTKKNWIPSSSGSVNVSFYYDSNRSTYRIISVDGSKAIINSTLVPNMTFTKTSQKFGQWSDARASTVYGLGFGSESDLIKFSEKFAEVRELTKQQLAPPGQPSPPVQQSGGTGDRIDNGHSQNQQHSIQNSEYMTPDIGRHGTSGNSMPDNNNQLKYENDRLKIALAQSSANAKKWEVELQTLKNNNARLTAALQETNANVEEWKKQLSAYKEENTRLKKMWIEHEQSQPNQAQELSNKQKEVTELMSKLNVSESEKRSAHLELEQLKTKAGQLAKFEETNKRQERDLQTLRSENSEMKSKLSALIDEMETLRSAQTTDKSELVTVHETLSRNVTELVAAQNKLARLLNS